MDKKPSSESVMDRRAFLELLIFYFQVSYASLAGAQQPAAEAVPDSQPAVSAKDHAGRTWSLQDWRDARPYPKPLEEREGAYLSKYAEHWDGKVWGNRILTPGNWDFEYLATLSDEVSEAIKAGSSRSPWGGDRTRNEVFAPGGGEPTDLYNSAGTVFAHLDLKTKKFTAIGSLGQSGMKDGYNAEAQLRTGGSDESGTMDRVTGRLFFRQAGKLRYVEKLYRYKDKTNGREYLLPAILDYKDLYRQVRGPAGNNVEPVYSRDGRADPAFAVRTLAGLGNLAFAGGLRGKRPLISPDGQTIYVSSDKDSWKVNENKLDRLAKVNIKTGSRSSVRWADPLPHPVSPPSPGSPGSHGGSCVGLDGKIYVCDHGGAGGTVGRLYSLDPGTGKIAILYNSIPPDGMWRGRGKPAIFDGPADYERLHFLSTRHQTQCPRTGAIYNGGWDQSSIRRYLDGFVTSIAASQNNLFGRPNWPKDFFKFVHDNFAPAVAPNGDLYMADSANFPLRYLRVYRTDWPAQVPEYAFGEKVLPRARLEELMLQHVNDYISRYQDTPPYLPKTSPS
jgi:hypothetical protein